ncbi:bifunctional [glutamine synthetase] adenylyltransferase/[glutamine synthetase]-adenylyl-L-tyrosine phosphorylase [Homoserinibacter sp. YIM 151385]|uniref:bifunctional [glutamine synthetase] adenylyltransferase/[glutamine synthetase]-adenylyl-L-tyrosine phosphorylase n=1 Tax=Homoserinibacter sp. YIM 151385 TaxID=2985506 RepID=UPI0022F0CD34|nr:bifunctional [glutamine synthetase] adenylyltransferase/[glutamine synthetase]-adenylyl-L-tyrosine phosphorylase [Homoserinibacter sp. YIM 151385]WBU38474.1 bifunctional [glutamine synthetase] adenylyltransferase/[glutamine synthetase]-adenylyl-L-tyrosine phosphorylase [Homoserinibacter sp. YIM 151385]
MSRSSSTLTELARLGFSDLERASARLAEAPEGIAPRFAAAADPDQALRLLLRLLEHAEAGPVTRRLLDDERTGDRLIRILGASEGLADFLLRRPGALDALEAPLVRPLDQAESLALLEEAVGELRGEAAWVAMRVAYRRQLLRLAAWDLEARDAAAVLDRVAAGLADLAGAALDAAIGIARRASAFPAADVARVRLAVIGMGKAGARELNYLSDVDVIYVVEGDGIDDDRAVQIGTRLAIDAAKAVDELAVEPGLWEVDANLRPEGKDGALVRTLDSHLAYYERWAKEWEFQALLKARAMAGDLELGERYVQGVSTSVWSVASRAQFVESVQRMRERVTAHIPAEEVDVQLKLGPGGLRDIEFTVQLLQLVHGQSDPLVRQRSSLAALTALAEQGYIGRAEAAEFTADYRFLRVLEHRIQLSRLRRTHLMPREEYARRALARASGLAATADELTAAWQRVRSAVRSLHERLFYRPLLTAVAALPDEGAVLTSAQAQARLQAIGYRDPAGALRHIAALTGGVSRRAAIQRTLLPVMLRWLSEGADPDAGLLAFRRLSDDLGETHWFLRMLRDSSGAAERLTQVLSSSRFVGALLERIPEAAGWLENDAELAPRPLEVLEQEGRAILQRHGDDVESAAAALRTARRRETLRVALGGILGLTGIEAIGHGLSAISTALLRGMLDLARRGEEGLEFGIIAMGRFGGRELGFGSDADILYVYRPSGAEPEDAQRAAERIVKQLVRLTEDLRLPLDLDVDLRPEGKNGPVVRSLESYRAYYARWSLTWEAQALLRASGVAGEEALTEAFLQMADGIRYPASASPEAVREVKRIKARVESERLPRGADPARHLKLGRGSLSDVEWLVQLLQLQHAADIPALRTTSTLEALEAVVEAGLLPASEASRLRDAWIIASRARSAVTLATAKTADSLPVERQALEAAARLMEYPPGSASRLEEDYLRVTRQARKVFERRFYGPRETP